jgi:hypothetical protein
MYAANSSTVLHSNIARSGTLVAGFSAPARRSAWPATNARPARRSCRAPHPLDLEHLGPDAGQGLFQLVARRQVVLAVLAADLDGRQGLAVELAVGVERQAVEPASAAAPCTPAGAQALLERSSSAASASTP